MTDEQIKQRADEYADKLYKDGRCTESTAPTIQEIYIAGAHSRDEEIEEMTRLKNSFAGGVDILDNDNKELQEEIDKLRNPWISVEDRLPEENPDNKGYSVEVIGLFSDGSICKCDCSIEEGIWFIGIFTSDPPTHWMPIPELKKGE